jgi:large subunit ribosomal protein L15
MRGLAQLTNAFRRFKRTKRVGRGPSSGMGKTSGRGHKGAGSRSGYKRRHTYEGGQFRLFQKLPQRGFSRARFRRELHSINLGMIDRYFQDGEAVNEETLRARGLVSGKCWGIKILGKGALSKKLTQVEVTAVSASAKQALEAAGIEVTLKGGRSK